MVLARRNKFDSRGRPLPLYGRFYKRLSDKLPYVPAKDLAWIAGFYEGEGGAGFYRISRKRNNKLYQSYRLVVGITQIEKSILYWIKRKVKMGSVGVQSNNRNNFYGWKCKKIYRYSLANNMARLFLKLILPYMKAKHKIKQAKLALKMDRHYIRGCWNASF